MKFKKITKEEDNWYGIKGATFIYHGDYCDPEVEYKGVSLNYWAIQDGLWEVFKDENPEGTEKEFDKWMETHPEEVKSELELQYDAKTGNQDDELDEFDESWIGDKVKSGWKKVKDGAKKVSKAIGDAFKGPFRKGDQIVMKGEDGEEFRGTIKSFDLGDKTYEVLLGNAVNEEWEGKGLEERVQEMPDRVDELESEIERLWKRLGDIGDKDEIVLNLISKYVELEKIEPGRVDFEESCVMGESSEDGYSFKDFKKFAKGLGYKVTSGRTSFGGFGYGGARFYKVFSSDGERVYPLEPNKKDKYGPGYWERRLQSNPELQEYIISHYPFRDDNGERCIPDPT